MLSPMTPEQVLKLFQQADSVEFTTPEVATALDISQPAAWQLLDQLAKEGFIERRVGVGLQSDTWRLAAEG